MGSGDSKDNGEGEFVSLFIKSTKSEQEAVAFWLTVINAVGR